MYLGAELEKRANDQQTLNRIISPKRGNIYDSTKEKILAVSASVETVTINPTIIPSDQKEKIAKAFSEILELDYDKTLKKVQKRSSIETIAKKVEKEKADELRGWMKDNSITTGINIDEDSKRYYPFNTLASHVIGFCGDENQGLEGIELKYNEVLKGEAGKIAAGKSATGEELPQGEESYVSPKDGDDIVLTIDANIQGIAEKYIKQAVIDNKCTEGANVIIMNPKNGDILAMASYPDYNLNTPFEPNTENLKSSWGNLETTEKTENLMQMWRNRAISDSYEPGSTFKIVTTSMALEEGITTPDKAGEFNCSGSITIAGVRIKCWRHYRPHGAQSLRQALGNSCNPIFIGLGQTLGVKTYYSYLEQYGLLGKTGIDLPGEAKGIFLSENKVGPVELATLAFGQRFEITPLQLITTAAGIVNDGKLMEPRVVKEIIHKDTGETEKLEPVMKNQIISKETSEQMRSMMEYVVVEGTAKHAGVQGFTVGGKTGTSEDGINTNKFIASFVGVSSIEAPELVILVTLNNPTGEGGHQGGGVAAPLAGQILGEVLPYLKSLKEENSINNNEVETVTVPEVRNKTVAEAINILKSVGLRPNVTIIGDKNEVIVTGQVPKPGIVLNNDSVVLLSTNE